MPGCGRLLTTAGHKVDSDSLSLLGVIETFQVSTAVVVTGLNRFVKIQHNVHAAWVPFTAYNVYCSEMHPDDPESTKERHLPVISLFVISFENSVNLASWVLELRFLVMKKNKKVNFSVILI